jgi:hypothetical protein
MRPAPPARLFLPVFGLLYAQLLLLLIFPGVQLYHYSYGLDHPPWGLYVVLDSKFLEDRAGLTCPQASVDLVGRDEWLLNSKPVKPNELPALVREGVNGNKHCFVFLRANPTLPYEIPIKAIELISEVPATVVLVTPKTEPLSSPLFRRDVFMR